MTIDLNGLRESWTSMWAGLTAKTDGSKLCEAILNAYAEPQRKYHSQQHLAECIAWFAQAAHLAEHPHEVQAALWFHDAIYELQSRDNEVRSEQWARAALGEAGVAIDAVNRISAMILATQHTAMPSGNDQQLLIDIDLSILGAAEERFAQYEQQIRGEYSFVPPALFAEKRAAILQSFQARPRIYSTELFFQRLEPRARENLAKTVGELSPK